MRPMYFARSTTDWGTSIPNASAMSVKELKAETTVLSVRSKIYIACGVVPYAVSGAAATIAW